ncbi:uncharacterized protein LOC123710458 [Pieris brassicae]|uniref:Thyroglobulin type-1 domain-containing protein n=1 Tax=Pieris brassicae TaxID=7116 RepID=A0A9P0XBL2_PIEBR|nr:uncharacterized protein LOC123710458 [Pieris brassicae]CAH4028797.1 unnamed protein product [Pieris brassicae]
MNIVLICITVVSVFLTTKLFYAQRCEKAQTCITDLTAEDCGVGLYTLTRNSHIFNCCPGCKLNAPEEEEEEEEDDDYLDHECMPPAHCLPDGSFSPVQCKGDSFTGRCFCADKKGRRIFGQMWRSEASEMSCACSRARRNLEEEGNVVTFHCTSTGDYEPLQCNNGMCWCAEPKTGQPTVTPVPEKDMTMLPCYSSSSVGEQYLRRCESITFALSTIQKEQTEHGTNFYGNPTTFCDYDGSYGSYQIQNGIAYCTGRDGKILGSWQAIVNEMNNMNCNCARDSSLHFPERGMTVAEVCQPNGNYRPDQFGNGRIYCVDSDGYSLERIDWPEVCVRASNGTA